MHKKGRNQSKPKPEDTGEAGKRQRRSKVIENL